MTQDNNSLSDFKEIQHLYDTAERFIKEVELCHASVPFPAINQLRYAGHHLLKGLVSTEQSGLTDELGDVKDHCHRAMYEAADAGLIYLLRVLKKFQSDFSDIPITPVVAEYPDILLTARKTKQQLSQGRLPRKSPKEQVEEYMAKFRELQDGVYKLESIRDELNKVKLEKRKKDRRFTLQLLFWIITVIVGIGGLILTFLTVS